LNTLHDACDIRIDRVRRHEDHLYCEITAAELSQHPEQAAMSAARLF
jgi:hypothetical protein